MWVPVKGELAGALEGGRVVLIIRCGGSHGRCGRVRAAMLEDGTIRSAEHVNCHRLDPAFRDAPKVREVFLRGRQDHAEAQRRGRLYRPFAVTVLPQRNRRRPDREQVQEREWQLYVASGECPADEEESEDEPV